MLKKDGFNFYIKIFDFQAEVWRRCGGGVAEVWRRCGEGRFNPSIRGVERWTAE
jgi:hypothetical protein